MIFLAWLGTIWFSLFIIYLIYSFIKDFGYVFISLLFFGFVIIFFIWSLGTVSKFLGH